MQNLELPNFTMLATKNSEGHIFRILVSFRLKFINLKVKFFNQKNIFHPNCIIVIRVGCLDSLKIYLMMRALILSRKVQYKNKTSKVKSITKIIAQIGKKICF